MREKKLKLWGTAFSAINILKNNIKNILQIMLESNINICCNEKNAQTLEGLH